MAYKNKKAISPVIATALLLVVAVVAVVGFQKWYTTYQSSVTASVEKQSDLGSVISIERLEVVNENQSKVYIKSSNDNELTGAIVKISGLDNCVNNNVDIKAKDVTEVILGNSTSPCNVTKGQTYDVLVQSSSGVYTEEEIARQ